MTREELAQQLKDVADMLEKPSSFIGPEGPDVGAFVGAVLGSTDTYTTREAVGEFVSQIEKHGGKQALENCLRDSGWVKAGEKVPIGAVVKAIEAMPPEVMRQTCNDLVQQLIDRSAGMRLAFADALEEHGYIEKESDSFDGAAEEWAEENGWANTNERSLGDLAESYSSSDVRDFVVEYIQDRL